MQVEHATVPVAITRREFRRIDPWSVLKVAVPFWLSLVMAVLLAGVMLWIAGSTLGVAENIQDFLVGIGAGKIRVRGGQMLRGWILGGVVTAVVGSGFTVLMAVIYNLVADIVGGIEIEVVDHEEL